jgi:antitoxin (DNA-binding transcriptional repressor) of toxin-antitoxin stability system
VSLLREERLGTETAQDKSEAVSSQIARFIWMEVEAGVPFGDIADVKTVEANKAAENFTRFLSQVLARQESFKIVKKGVPCAYLVPAGEHKCDSHELAEDLASAEFSEKEDRRDLAAALARGRKALKSLKNPWG